MPVLTDVQLPLEEGGLVELLLQLLKLNAKIAKSRRRDFMFLIGYEYFEDSEMFTANLEPESFVPNITPARKSARAFE